MKIHPTALIDPAAQIGSGVEIGPYAIIGGQVTIGANSRVGSHVVLEGNVSMGKENVIGHGAIIGGWPQDLSFDGQTQSGVEIGARNIIREHCTIHRGASQGSVTSLGDENFLMAGAHVGHNCAIANSIIIANNCLLAGYVSVADGAFLGGGSVFHQHVRVGRLVMTQGNSGSGKDIPPFTIASGVRSAVVGLNVIGLRRAGFSPRDRDEIKAAFKLVYLSGLNTQQALAQSAGRTWSAAAQEFFDFIAAAKQRGICPFGKKSGERE